MGEGGTGELSTLLKNTRAPPQLARQNPTAAAVPLLPRSHMLRARSQAAPRGLAHPQRAHLIALSPQAPPPPPACRPARSLARLLQELHMGHPWLPRLLTPPQPSPRRAAFPFPAAAGLDPHRLLGRAERTAGLHGLHGPGAVSASRRAPRRGRPGKSHGGGTGPRPERSGSSQSPTGRPEPLTSTKSNMSASDRPDRSRCRDSNWLPGPGPGR